MPGVQKKLQFRQKNADEELMRFLVFSLLFVLMQPASAQDVNSCEQTPVDLIPSEISNSLLPLENLESLKLSERRYHDENICPEVLSAADCKIFDRYHAVTKALRAQGVSDPDRIASVIGPRFINLPDWEAANQKGIYDPNEVYKPAPLTWQSWENAAKLSDDSAKLDYLNFVHRDLTLDWITKLHHAALSGQTRSGEMREGHDIGMSLDRNTTLTIAQIKALKALEYKSLLDKKKPIVKWVATKCLDEVQQKDTVDNTKYYASKAVLLNQNHSFLAAGERRQCGYIEYSEPKEVPTQLQKLLADYKKTVASWSTDHALNDPVTTAAKLQRWFISIHPYNGGNGRTSRLLMDQVLQSEGLPSPILKQMNDDMSTSEKDWAKEIRRGMVRTIEVMEACAKDTTKAGCNVVPRPK